jgi:hypothetical protein
MDRIPVYETGDPSSILGGTANFWEIGVMDNTSRFERLAGGSIPSSPTKLIIKIKLTKIEGKKPIIIPFKEYGKMFSFIVFIFNRL